MRYEPTTRSWWLHMLCVMVAALAVTVGFAPAVQAQVATPAASLDEILKDVSSYDGGIASAAVWKLRSYVQAHRDDKAERAECEAKLLQFLKNPATPAAKLEASRQLRLIAGDTTAPALGALLANEETADFALYVLARISGRAADDALLQALDRASGPTKVGILAALGERKSTAAVPAIVPLVQQAEYARAAVTALGKIATDGAAAALIAALAGAPADLKAVVAGAMLRIAEARLAARNAGGALRLYETVSSDASLPPPVRRAAAMGQITAWGPAGSGLLLNMLAGSDPVQQQAAVAKIKDVIQPDAIGRVSALLPRLPAHIQVPVLAVLADYPGALVQAVLVEAVRSEAVEVRIAALQALASAGGPSVVSLLAETAARARGPEQVAARSALGMLKGRAVDEAIVTLLAQKPPDDVQRELLMAVADRRIFLAKPAVADALTAGSHQVRVQALRSLRVIGTPSDIPAVLDVLLKTDNEVEQSEAEQAAAALAIKIANPDARSAPVRTRLAALKEPAARARLMGVFPLIGDRSALPVLRAALDTRVPEVVDAAVRAIAAWPTSAARDDLLRLARRTTNETHRLLAIRGLVRSVALDTHREPAAVVEDLKVAASLASRPEEQRLILGALTRFPCREALDLARKLQRERLVRAEAQAAIDSITARLSRMAGGRSQ